MECGLANSLEVFVADDVLEGGAAGERHLFDDFELIGESDTREAARVKTFAVNLAEVFVEDYFLERRAFEETAPFEYREAFTT